MIGDLHRLQLTKHSNVKFVYHEVGRTTDGRLIVVGDDAYHGVGTWAESARVTDVTHTHLVPDGRD